MNKILLAIVGMAILGSCASEQRRMSQHASVHAAKHSQHLKQIDMKKIQFDSEGAQLTGNLFYPPNLDANQTYPAIVVSGSWTTVKEQMAGLYAEKLANQGFITLAFDFRNFGESEGEPRFYESPAAKKLDIQNAVTYLATLPEVNASQIGAMGICAGAMYTVMAAAEDDRIQTVVTAASWLHDAEAVKLFYGGEEGVQAKIHAAQAAKRKYADEGVVEYIPTISTEDPGAAMYGPYDYYLNPSRGAIPQWSADKFAVMSWEDWLTADPMPSAPNLTVPTLMIHSDGAVLPQYTRNFFEKLGTSDKKLHWMETDLESPFHQFKYYDQTAEVNESIEEATSWFREKLTPRSIGSR
ncbi:alpha/beta fold hydrolase [Pontibacter sp. G13]|uniref:alpha/beta hydrolase n=1 Tax=Pontibacter sp. G13 TaxID=3074898 RepID=UPI00288A7BD5|nr:alpha/beta fold hydrolase [Pontibacter sp. G13]WNJ18299.1 alpha/beta fold hydrolase [Pontibacter sp. G13]